MVAEASKKSEDSESEQEEEVKADEAAPAVSEVLSKDVFKVFVGGLPFSWDKTTLRTHFSQCGEIDWLHMPMDARERSRGFAFVSYKNMEAVQEALKFHGQTYEGQVMKVNMASEKPAKAASEAPKGDRKPRAAGGGNVKDRQVFVSGLPFKAEEATIRKDFAECGEIAKLVMPKTEDGRSKGIAFVTYRSLEGLEAALAFHGTDYGGRLLTVRRATEAKAAPEEKVETPSKAKRTAEAKTESVAKVAKKRQRAEEADPQLAEPNAFEVVVKGLGFKTTEDDLKAALAECGEIDKLRMPLSKKRRCMGFAFVCFQEKKGMKRALKLTGTELCGRPATIERMAAPADRTEAPAASAGAAAEAAEEPPPRKRKRSEAADAEAEGAAEDEADAPKRKNKLRPKVVEEGDDDAGDEDGEQTYTKEEILARTKANRERRKAKREELRAAAKTAEE
eukprot:TRINITY_DN55797_c0_g1_i1.p1 TRINITY_DN55797_c0_g1~~TRINITY_DN55797_c0_g1_i1.p1  ORF type:complete len:450 (+),score=130.00 TRINITY_DN55797_c0_g1_i1:43-1392(+)